MILWCWCFHAPSTNRDWSATCLTHSTYCWWFRNPAFTSWFVGSFSHYLQTFIHTSQVVGLGISCINSMKAHGIPTHCVISALKVVNPGPQKKKHLEKLSVDFPLLMEQIPRSPIFHLRNFPRFFKGRKLTKTRWKHQASTRMMFALWGVPSANSLQQGMP